MEILNQIKDNSGVKALGGLLALRIERQQRSNQLLDKICRVYTEKLEVIQQKMKRQDEQAAEAIKYQKSAVRILEKVSFGVGIVK